MSQALWIETAFLSASDLALRQLLYPGFMMAYDESYEMPMHAFEPPP